MNIAMIVVLIALVVFSVWTVLAGELLFSAIGLALTSALLSCVLFLMDMPWAAVFELSVCAGLITVVFISAISLTRPQGERSEEERALTRRGRLRNIFVLPLLLVVAALVVGNLPQLSWQFLGRGASVDLSVQQLLWFTRRYDLVGQILAILTGVFGVVVLFKSMNHGAQDVADGGSSK